MKKTFLLSILMSGSLYALPVEVYKCEDSSSVNDRAVVSITNATQWMTIDFYHHPSHHQARDRVSGFAVRLRHQVDEERDIRTYTLGNISLSVGPDGASSLWFNNPNDPHNVKVISCH